MAAEGPNSPAPLPNPEIEIYPGVSTRNQALASSTPEHYTSTLAAILVSYEYIEVYILVW